MHIKMNGIQVELPAPISLAELLKSQGITTSTARVAVALNERIVFRSEWDMFIAKEGDRIEIIHAVQGG